ncbi:solute carrier family 41 member 3-like [Prorops nasuta]|uniref:solute carrier family 41 member 3-like n=1 Tax=Prorops nasuta TaxID=863751 RepID=UPI0034CD59C2
MVAFPDSGIEPTLLNEESLNEKNSSEFKEVLPELIDSYKMRDEPFTISRILLKSEKDSFSLDIACIQDMKIDSPTDDIKTDANVVKKVAAGLKTPNGQKKKEEMSISGFGGGSLSSGSSIITISSVTNSDPDPEFIKSPNDKKPENTERWYHTTLQVAVPFFIAGIGTIGAGLVLDEVMNWPVYKAVSQLFILIPSLLGLKGNLDMCLASRLSTQANLGNMQGLREISKMVIGNLALVQIQATVAAILVAIFAMTIGAISNGSFEWKYAMLLISASVCTATSSCFILDFVMIAVIMISHRCKMNPDNLATPLAASVGDVVSTSVLSAVASQLFLRLDNEMWTLYVIMLGYLLLLPFWIYVVLHNHYTRNVLTSGWVPVLSALFISGFGGLILGKVVNLFFGFVIFQPIINGIGGNLVSVQASRISTMLHKSSIMGIVPPHIKILVSPWKALFKGVPYAKTARILIAMAIPGHLVFVFAADYIKWGHRTLQPYFVVSYILVSVMQVMILLYIAHIMIHAMWKYKIDPDNSAIPYLTALGDLIGSILLALAFWFLKAIHREYGPE